MSIVQINDHSFDKSLLNKGVTLIEFGAEWCPPCKVLMPILKQIDHKYTEDQLSILTVDCDQSPQLASQYGIMSMPTVVLFSEGEPVVKLVGLRSQNAYEQLINRYLMNKTSAI